MPPKRSRKAPTAIPTASARQTRGQKAAAEKLPAAVVVVAEEVPAPAVASKPAKKKTEAKKPAKKIAAKKKPAQKKKSAPEPRANPEGSPMKKSKGTAAGIPRASGERSPVNGGFPNNQDENDDYCASCGGNGELVCCDGCPRAFHLKCVDLPTDEDDLRADWYCFVCLAKNNPRPQEENRGIFSSLLANLERQNPRAFHLPKDIREHFENVKTGTEGEYEEVLPPKPKTTKANEEEPDYFRLRDSKGNGIFCHNCGGMASAPGRPIVPCAACGLSWHLDCVDPPLAKPPGINRKWKCPTHVDDLLASLPVVLGPAHRFRKIKGSEVVRPVITRGLKNNGQIEVELDPSDDEAEPGFYEQTEYGKVYKLPEMGIKLDFIAQVKRKFGSFPVEIPAKRQKTSIPRSQRKQDTWNKRTIDERQAALNLASLAVPEPAANDYTDTMIKALVAQAPPAVTKLLAKDASESMSKDELRVLHSIVTQALVMKSDGADEQGVCDDSGPAEEVAAAVNPDAEAAKDVSPVVESASPN